MWVGVLDAEIINDQGESEVGFVVAPEAGGDGHRSVAMRSKKGGEAIVRNTSRLGQTVHAFAAFSVDEAIVDQWQ